jgi:hypothetical protein
MRPSQTHPLDPKSGGCFEQKETKVTKEEVVTTTGFGVWRSIRQVKRLDCAFRVQAILFVSFVAFCARRICRFQVDGSLPSESIANLQSRFHPAIRAIRGFCAALSRLTGSEQGPFSMFVRSSSVLNTIVTQSKHNRHSNRFECRLSVLRVSIVLTPEAQREESETGPSKRPSVRESCSTGLPVQPGRPGQ